MDILLEGGAALQRQRLHPVGGSKSQYVGILSGEDRSRWEIMQDSTLALATQWEHFDPNGITVYLFAEDFQRYDHITSEKVAQIFETHRPQGKANLAPALKHAIAQYFKRRAILTSQPNGEIILIVTAGEIADL